MDSTIPGSASNVSYLGEATHIILLSSQLEEARMQEPLVVISLKRRKSHSGTPLKDEGPKRQSRRFSEKRIHTRGRRLAVCLSLLVLAASAVLYCMYHYLGSRGQPPFPTRLVSAVKLFIASKVDPEQDAVLRFVKGALEERTALLLGGDLEAIEDNYDLDSPSGIWAYENEVNRITYLTKWAQARNVRMAEAASTFEVDSVFKEGEGSYWIELTEHTLYAYEYPQNDLLLEPVLALEASLGVGNEASDIPSARRVAGNLLDDAQDDTQFVMWDIPATRQSVGNLLIDTQVTASGVPPVRRLFESVMVGTQVTASDEASVRHEFGSRTVHVIQVIKTDEGWKIRKDWYMDPLGNSVTEPGQGAAALGLLHDAAYLDYLHALDAGAPKFDSVFNAEATGAFDREKALRYAVKHSGVRVLPGGGKYNGKYKIYTFAGGDCANFVSQVLHAGGIPMGHGWHYTKEGSTAWVQSESLVWHLLSSGRGLRLFRGTFSEAGSGVQPESPAGRLEPGDIIAYEKKGQVSHVAVVVGKDPRGYVTIASHTADRLYFPWDLGWDDSAVFWFIKITY